MIDLTVASIEFITLTPGEADVIFDEANIYDILFKAIREGVQKDGKVQIISEPACAASMELGVIGLWVHGIMHQRT